ncbi:MAG: hypothetical protein K1060chlam2_00939 [Chlamydiae bacterium]|nr:hypothetical protein [Chlamydiota bacterium]
MKLQKIFSQAKEEIRSYSKSEKLFLLFAMLCGFFINAEYAITKPTSNSIFIAHYGVKLYPYAWLATVPLNLLVVTLYNRFLPRLGCFRMFLLTIVLTMGINVISGIFVAETSSLSLLLYIWKDIYVLLMFQQLWSVIHTRTEMSQAKYLYGILFGAGGCGAIIGSMVPSFLAVRMGSEQLLFLTVPLYLLFICFYYLMLRQSGYLNSRELKIASHKVSQGMKLISSSSPLKFILLIVVLMQLSTTIMEYQFNTYLFQHYPLQDLRTQFCGRLWGVINSCQLSLQFFATFILVQFIGLRKSHFVVPGMLLLNSALLLFKPSFAMVTYSFGLIKTFDYSIFNIIKEMLYVPLNTDEKFKAKAIIDIFAYRSAKALASLFVIGMQIFYPLHLPYAYTWGPFTLLLLWMSVVFFLLKEAPSEKPLEASV